MKLDQDRLLRFARSLRLKTRFLQGIRVTVVPKPFDPDTMLRAIRFLLDED